MKHVFPLENEPIDLQISIHINNLFNTFPRYEVLDAYDFVKVTKDFKTIYQVYRPGKDNDKLSYVIYTLMMKYGIRNINRCLADLFSEKVA